MFKRVRQCYKTLMPFIVAFDSIYRVGKGRYFVKCLRSFVEYHLPFFCQSHTFSEMLNEYSLQIKSSQRKIHIQQSIPSNMNCASTGQALYVSTFPLQSSQSFSIPVRTVKGNRMNCYLLPLHQLLCFLQNEVAAGIWFPICEQIEALSIRKLKGSL